MIAVQVVQSQLYGCTYELVKHYLQDRLDIQVTFVDSANVDEFKMAIRPNTKVCMITLSNNRCIYDKCVVPRGGRKVKEKYTDIADCSLTCHTATGPHMPHIGSHSVTCHPAEVTFPPLSQPKLVLD